MKSLLDMDKFLDADKFHCKKCKRFYDGKDFNKPLRLCKDCFLKTNMLRGR